MLQYLYLQTCFEWVKANVCCWNGSNQQREGSKLYDFIDNSKLYKGTVVPEDRSLMNVPFITGSDELDALFVKESKKAGMENLKGHRSVGGMRASIYNAMPMAGIDTLIDFMQKFEKRKRLGIFAKKGITTLNYKVQTLNNISKKGLKLLGENYTVLDQPENPDAILLRSFKMHDMDIPASVKFVGRAGAGVNNIPWINVPNRALLSATRRVPMPMR